MLHCVTLSRLKCSQPIMPEGVALGPKAPAAALVYQYVKASQSPYLLIETLTGRWATLGAFEGQGAQRKGTQHTQHTCDCPNG